MFEKAVLILFISLFIVIMELGTRFVVFVISKNNNEKLNKSVKFFKNIYIHIIFIMSILFEIFYIIEKKYN